MNLVHVLQDILHHNHVDESFLIGHQPLLVLELNRFGCSLAGAVMLNHTTGRVACQAPQYYVSKIAGACLIHKELLKSNNGPSLILDSGAATVQKLAPPIASS